MVISRRAFLGTAMFAAVQQETRPGRRNLKLEYGRDGVLYVPIGYKAGVPTPLVVMLHGAGGSGERMAHTFALGDEFGAIILAPDSRDERSWDVVLGAWGPDVEFLGRAVRQTFDLCSVDRGRICLAGFSDGASYALSVGISAGETFSHIAAFSPGLMRPYEVSGRPRIFISHGVSDQVMPVELTSGKFVPALKSMGYDVTYREYDGRHAVPLPIVHEAFAWFLK
jgi:phospholipase/carboxylesterase